MTAKHHYVPLRYVDAFLAGESLQGLWLDWLATYAPVGEPWRTVSTPPWVAP